MLHIRQQMLIRTNVAPSGSTGVSSLHCSSIEILGLGDLFKGKKADLLSLLSDGLLSDSSARFFGFHLFQPADSQIFSTMAAAAAASLAVMSVPDAYGIVEPGVYRASALSVHNLHFVSNLHLRTLLHLSPDSPSLAIMEFLSRSSIKLIHLGAREGKPASWKPVSENLVKDALEILLDATMHPILITCTSGVRQTGTLVGCLRKLQKWNLTSVIEEYRRFAGNKAHYANEQFMELFDEDLVTLPKNLAPWFADQQKMMEEEEAEFHKQMEERQLQQQHDSSNNLLHWPPRTSQDTAQGKEIKTSCSSYARYYYHSSCPLTTEDRYRKQRIMTKTE